jgi:hypothetical protein
MNSQATQLDSDFSVAQYNILSEFFILVAVALAPSI